MALGAPQALERTVSQASGKGGHQLITVKPQAPVDGRESPATAWPQGIHWRLGEQV